jgi:hypothetical protein
MVGRRGRGRRPIRLPEIDICSRVRVAMAVWHAIQLRLAAVGPTLPPRLGVLSIPESGAGLSTLGPGSPSFVQQCFASLTFGCVFGHSTSSVPMAHQAGALCGSATAFAALRATATATPRRGHGARSNHRNRGHAVVTRADAFGNLSNKLNDAWLTLKAGAYTRSLLSST